MAEEQITEIEVGVTFCDRLYAEAVAETPAEAVLAARVLYDDTITGVGQYGSHRNVRTTFRVGDEVVRMYVGRPPTKQRKDI